MYMFCLIIKFEKHFFTGMFDAMILDYALCIKFVIIYLPNGQLIKTNTPYIYV